MIKNIVFDLGNVVVKFDSSDLITRFFDSNQFEVKSFYFDSLWNEYDQGLHTKEEMIDKGIRAFPMLKKEIQNMMDHWTEFVIPNWENIAYIKELKTLGYRVYILSNIPEDDTKYLMDKGVFKDTDGAIFSYQEKLIKPDLKIFERFLVRYSLDAKECLFLDDRIENCRAAQMLGFETIEVPKINQVIDLLKEKLK